MKNKQIKPEDLPLEPEDIALLKLLPMEEFLDYLMSDGPEQKEWEQLRIKYDMPAPPMKFTYEP